MILAVADTYDYPDLIVICEPEGKDRFLEKVTVAPIYRCQRYQDSSESSSGCM